MFPYNKILFKMSGSIAAYKACELISTLVKSNVEVQVVVTQELLKFIGKATLEGLTQKQVIVDTFTDGQMMKHIHLDRWADAVILCPATANTINEMAVGVANDMVKTLFLAHDFKKPYYVIPAMNEKMWTHPATVSSVVKLKEWGVTFLEPTQGHLACGEVGEGRMLEPQEIVRVLSNKTQKGRVLITSGGTREPIDGVRYIGNISTGATGAAIADQFIRAGFDVTFLRSEYSLKPKGHCEDDTYVTFEELKEKLFQYLGGKDYDIVIHSAAVSDFGVDSLVLEGRTHPQRLKGKITSSNEVLLKLKRNPKLINNIKEISKNKNIKLVGFKLTVGIDDPTEEINKILNDGHADYVVYNDMMNIDEKNNLHSGTLYSKNSRVSDFKNKADLATLLTGVLGG